VTDCLEPLGDAEGRFAVGIAVGSGVGAEVAGAGVVSVAAVESVACLTAAQVVITVVADEG